MKMKLFVTAKGRLSMSEWKALIWLPVMAVSLFCHDASAQERRTGGDPSIAKHVRARYKVDHIYSRLQKTENGPSGSIYIIGDMTPAKMGRGATKAERVRETAKALIQEEPDIFGPVDFNGLREQVFGPDEYGYTHIGYRRYIGNLPLQAMNIMVHVGPDERISSVSATIVPVPAELYQEVAKETISEESLSSIIGEDLKAANVKYSAIRVLRSEKIARPVSPYIVWVVDMNLIGGSGRWIYEIDAFTGKIVEKRNALIAD